MATADDVSMASKRSVPGKRRLSRDSALPDVTNLPVVHPEDRTARRQPMLAHRTASLSAASGQENEEAAGGGRAAGQMDKVQQVQHVQPERAAKIAAKAKMKAVITPWGHTRRRKSSQKAPSAPVHVTPPLPPPTPPLPPPPPEEPMEIDHPVLVTPAMELLLMHSVVDIDDHDDYLLVPEYAQDIVAYMKEQESRAVLPPDYMALNPDISSQMRGILVDWLIQVQTHEQLEDETLQLAVTVTDLYLARAHVPLAHLQLLGITCLLLAAKFVERFPPLVGTLCALTAGTYQDSEVLEMEKGVLCVLGFSLGLPLPHFFLRRLLQVHHHDLQVERLANYLVDLSLPSVHFVPVAPSLLAASALYVARRVWLPEELEPWSPGLVIYSGYTLKHLASTVLMLAKILLRAPLSKYQGARHKHSAEVPYGAISIDPVLDNHPVLLQLVKDSLCRQPANSRLQSL